MFRQYHYLNTALPPACRCYTTVYQNRPVAFLAAVHTKMKASYYRVTRLVVLPDYQGIGIGKRFLNFIAELYSSQTKLPFQIVTSNPQLIRGNIRNWKITRFGHASFGRGKSRINDELRESLSRKRNYSKQRKPLAAKLKNPRILQITFHTFRHWKATMEYHKTRDILHVKEILGHKSLDNTMKYTQLIKFKDDEFSARIAHNQDEACKLIEDGFEFVCDFDGNKLFRKRK